jgi:hypothetical protein
VSPGTAAGEASYPQAFERFSQLVDAAEAEGWAVDTAFNKMLFENAVRPRTADTSPNRELLLNIADNARLALVPSIRAKARSLIVTENLIYENVDLARLESAFERGVPCSGAENLAHILNAGWKVFIQKFFSTDERINWGFPVSDTPKVLNELLLKSFEILEIESRLKDGECSTPQKLLV